MIDRDHMFALVEGSAEIKAKRAQDAAKTLADGTRKVPKVMQGLLDALRSKDRKKIRKELGLVVHALGLIADGRGLRDTGISLKQQGFRIQQEA